MEPIYSALTGKAASLLVTNTDPEYSDGEAVKGTYSQIGTYIDHPNFDPRPYYKQDTGSNGYYYWIYYSAWNESWIFANGSTFPAPEPSTNYPGSGGPGSFSIYPSTGLPGQTPVGNYGSLTIS